MKFFTYIVGALLAASGVNALPGRSPICDVTDAGNKIAASKMGANKSNLKDSVRFTVDKQQYQPGQTVTISMQGPGEFNGFLLYATAAGAAPDARVGSFAVPAGMQSNKDRCPGSQDVNSVLTHTAGAKYAPSMQFTFTAPAQDMGEIRFNAIVLQGSPATGFSWGVFPNFATVASPKGPAPAGAPAPAGTTPCNTPVPPPPPPPPASTPCASSTVAAVQPAPSCPQVAPQTITQMMVSTVMMVQTSTMTMMQTVTAAPITKIRKCKPKGGMVQPPAPPAPAPAPVISVKPVAPAPSTPCPTSTAAAVVQPTGPPPPPPAPVTQAPKQVAYPQAAPASTAAAVKPAGYAAYAPAAAPGGYRF
ncbi:hypothetical protein HK102_007684 [Quaeritorhiza haematococci]|nr:hypothetical protein HK102_007684 [Quaeritorhiza haematococci]